jgi:pyruvate dehydrogenase E1 component alpha subunit
MEVWLKRDPIKQLERMLSGEGLLNENLVEEIAGEVREQMDDAVAFALNSPDPPPEAAVDLVYCPSEGA